MIKFVAFVKHPLHVGHLARIPVSDVSVECVAGRAVVRTVDALAKQIRHVCDLRRIPAADGPVRDLGRPRVITPGCYGRPEGFRRE